MTEHNAVRGTVVPGTIPDGSNTGRYYARFRAFAVTLGLGPVFVLIQSFVLPRVGDWPVGACVLLAGAAAVSARTSRVQFLWARLD